MKFIILGLGYLGILLYGYMSEKNNNEDTLLGAMFVGIANFFLSSILALLWTISWLVVFYVFNLTF